MRFDLVAIRPFRVRAKPKIINRATLIDRPARSNAGNDFAPSVKSHKTLEKLVENVAFDQGCRLVRIERSRIAKLAAMTYGQALNSLELPLQGDQETHGQHE